MDIALSKRMDPVELKACIQDALPGFVVHVCHLASESPWAASDVVVSVSDNPSEFPCSLSVGVVLADDSMTGDWLRALARHLSINLGCRAFCDGSELGDDESPYWGVVWDRGEAFLADDRNTLLADGAGGPVRVLRSLPELSAPGRPIDLAASVRRRVG